MNCGVSRQAEGIVVAGNKTGRNAADVELGASIPRRATEKRTDGMGTHGK